MVSVLLLLYAVLSTSIFTVRGVVSAGLQAHRADGPGASTGAPTGPPTTPGAGLGAKGKKSDGVRGLPGAGALPESEYGIGPEPANWHSWNELSGINSASAVSKEHESHAPFAIPGTLTLPTTLVEQEAESAYGKLKHNGTM